MKSPIINNQSSNNFKYPISKIFHWLLVIGVYLVIGAWSLVIPVYALSINLDNPSIKLTIKPGESKTGEITIRNMSGSPVKIKTYTEDWIYAPDGSKTFMKPGSSVFSCSNWIVLDRDTFELGPREEKKVTYAVSAPKNISGSHVSVIFFESLVEQSSGIAVSGRIGSIVYLDTEGDTKRNGDLGDISVITSEEGSPINIKVPFVNKGNSYIQAKAKATLSSENKVIEEIAMRDINTLPGDTGSGNASFSPQQQGKYKVKFDISYNGKDLSKDTDFNVKKISSK